MARYPPIAAPGLIGDLHTVALVGDERTRFDRSTSLLAVVASALLRAACGAPRFAGRYAASAGAPRGTSSARSGSRPLMIADYRAETKQVLMRPV
jgi:hypothetical protein